MSRASDLDAGAAARLLGIGDQVERVQPRHQHRPVSVMDIRAWDLVWGWNNECRATWAEESTGAYVVSSNSAIVASSECSRVIGIGRYLSI